ncbi:4Fe-4S ferredoxin iron-sulfur binding domain protein [Pseudodesulfovibrio mercurii]|uniref:4Fe-4S ferredoxin iron-sulfur binding domain protein n=1 Tax=Pseudodesulfovibrio mercurii TaxID=641491 RepID=F0JIY9_9BACT|nr:4Fe-4S binding protein [Pseudodesulfovibrio mercurii]EGB15888.1 4Fe-4S ferredoxin iron-sulfur binding domain protein [Pseudodesulfovibrio mercurii]
MKITPDRFRLAVQAAFTLLSLYAGYRFLLFLDWVAGRSDVFTPKPGAVEGFLPISALLGFRRLVSSGFWDRAHPAGLAVFLAALVMAFLFRKGFCGYICPVGFLSGLLERAGRRLGLAKVPPRKLDLALHAFKYLAMAAFLFAVFAMDPRSLESFLRSPFNLTSDARMLDFFLHPSGLALSVLAALVLLSLLVRNFWCRYLCPYGALLGLLAWFGPVRVTRDKDACVHCGKCSASCPSGIAVEKKDRVLTPECIGCGQCIGACPVKGCLGFSALGHRIPWQTVAVGAVLVLVIARLWAGYAGAWDNPLPPDMLKRIYQAGAGL